MSVKELNDLLVERRSLVEKIRAVPSEDVEQYEALTAQVADLDKRAAGLEEGLSKTLSSVTTKRGTSPYQGPSVGFNIPNDNQVLRSWLRLGRPSERSGDRETLEKRGFSPSSSSLEFRTAQAAGTGSLGGYVVPQDFLAEISRTMKAIAPVLQVARVITTEGGNTLKIPCNDDTSNTGRLLTENTQNAETGMTFTEISVSAYKFSSDLVLVSTELLEDTGVDLVGFLGSELGNRIGRCISTYLTTGTGSSQPQGIVAAAGTVNAGSATAIALNDIVTLIGSPDPAWLQMAGTVGFMMHQNVWTYLRKLLDGQNRPLVGDVQNGADLRLLGYPVFLNNYMDSTLASTKKSVLFGNFSQYLVRQTGNIVVKRSDDLKFDYDQSAFVAYYRMDAKALQSGALKVLLH